MIPSRVRTPFGAVLLAVCVTAAAAGASPTRPAFPGCQGFGCETAGGRGGKILRVTTLADSGPGSLRAAFETPGPRTILFDVAGVIRLASPIFLGGPPDPRGDGSRFGSVTMAGQSAPAGGVTVAEYGLILTNGVSDVVIRHLRFRNQRRDLGREPIPSDALRPRVGPGEDRPLDARGRPRRYPPSGRERPPRGVRPPRPERQAPEDRGLRSTGDGIDMLGAHRVVIDQCSFAWATDENVSAERFDNTDITISRSILAEVLAEGGHEGGDRQSHEHSRAMNFSRGADRVTVQRNLFASNMRRNPHLVGCSGQADRCRPEWPEHPVFDVRCNVVYNWGEKGVHAAGGPHANVVANLFVPGPDTPPGSRPVEVEDRDPSWGTRLWVEGNVDLVLGDETRRLVGGKGGPPVLADAPWPTPSVTPCAPRALRDQARAWGALPHDPVDVRLLGELASGRGSVGGGRRTHDDAVPSPEVGERRGDRDGDALPDAWERSRSLDPGVSDDPWADPDGDGWSLLEEWLEERAADGPGGPETGGEADLPSAPDPLR